jgi:hypothetical protein
MSEKPSCEAVRKLTIRIVFLHEVSEPRKGSIVKFRQICFCETLAKLPQVRTSPDLFDQFFGFCIEPFEAARIVANQINPG